MDKSWFKSKTFWGALLGILGLVGAGLRGDISWVVAFEGVMAFLAAFGIRTALK